MSKSSIHARKLARRALVQAVYQWQLSGGAVAEVERQFLEGESLKKADADFFGESLRRVIQGAAHLDQQIAPLLDRTTEALDPVERAILRLGADELLNRVEVPYRVVIDEYVNLAKVFGAEESHKYINGVLDKFAQQVRAVEYGR